jgi:Spy/CpxP family protein refolding chaperone
MTLAVVAVLGMSGAAWAQEPTPTPPQDGGGGRGARRLEAQDPAREAEQRARVLKERLELTDEQVQKAVEIYKQTREAEQKLETERQTKIREILTDDQKKKYDELVQNPGGRGRGPMAMGGFDRMLDNWAETLKKELTLADEPFEKIKAIVEELRKKMQERIAELRQGGLQGMNWQEEWKKFQDGLKESSDKIKEHLTPEQKGKFDKLLEQFQPGRGFDPRGPSPEERAGRIVESLKIEKSDEQAAVKSALLKVFEAQRALGEYDRDMRGKVEELQRDSSLTDEQLIAKITEIRTARLEKDKAVKAAQKDLREMVSARQELELIRQFILR